MSRTTQELEEWLQRTGYLGRYSDAAHNCFCNEPAGDRAVNTINFNAVLADPMGRSVDPSRLIKKPAILKPVITKSSFDPKKFAAQLKRERNIQTPVLYAKTQTIGRMFPGMRILASREGYRFYTIDKVEPPTENEQLPEEIPEVRTTTSNITTTLPDEENLADLQVKPVKFGGNWIWILLVAGGIYYVFREKKPKKVEA
ncbi:MAG: hypothetical protein AAGF96_18850 [Bacteroidota bacterium]